MAMMTAMISQMKLIVDRKLIAQMTNLSVTMDYVFLRNGCVVRFLNFALFFIKELFKIHH